MKLTKEIGFYLFDGQTLLFFKEDIENIEKEKI